MSCPYCLDWYVVKDGIEAHLKTDRHRNNYLLHRFDRDKMRRAVENVDIISRSNVAIEKKNGLQIGRCKVGEQIKFEFVVENSDKDDEIYLTEMRRLYQSPIFTLWDEYNIHDRGPPENVLSVKLLPESSTGLKISVNCVAAGSFRCPVHFRFTKFLNTEEQKDFSIVRELEIRVTDEDSVIADNSCEEETDSPFQGDTWRECEKTVKKTSVKGRFGSSSSNKNFFKIPQNLKEILAKELKPWKGISVENKMLLDKTVEKYAHGLTRSNYQSFFHDLLYMEEHSIKRQLAKYNMTGITVKYLKDGTVLLDVIGLAEKRPSVLKYDLIYLRVVNGDTWETIQYEGQVTDVREKSVVISGLHPLLLSRLEKAQLKNDPLHLAVKFTFSRYPLVIQHSAVDFINREKVKLSMLFPDASTAGKKSALLPEAALNNLEFVNEKVRDNGEQRTAVMNIVRGTSLPAPHIVFGPPGTGKTVTLVEAIVQVRRFLPTSKILVCAQSNSACDHIAIKLMETGQFARQIHSPDSKLDKLIRFNSINRADPVSQAIEAISTFEARSQHLLEANVCVCTLIGSSRMQPDSYTHVFIDEAGQAAECEALVPMSALHQKGLLVLAGDPKQLGPVCCSERAQFYGLGVSLLDRLMDRFQIYQQTNGQYNQTFITKLLLNFRSHPEILGIGNELFYQNELIPQCKIDPLSQYCFKTGNTEGGSAIIFHSVLHIEQREGKSPSFFNSGELAEVIKYVRKLLSPDFPISITPDEIGVITPYARQVYRIRNELMRLGFGGVSVGTVEVFQGREKRVIILSTVRSQVNMLQCDKKFRLGFVRNERRFNVATSRARAKLIIIGNAVLLGLDPCWKHLITKAMTEGNFVGCPVTLRDELWVDNCYSAVTRIKERDQNERA